MINTTRMHDRSLRLIGALFNLQDAMARFSASPDEDAADMLQIAIENYSASSQLVIAQVENLIKVANASDGDEITIEAVGNEDEGYEL